MSNKKVDPTTDIFKVSQEDSLKKHTPLLKPFNDPTVNIIPLYIEDSDRKKAGCFPLCCLHR